MIGLLVFISFILHGVAFYWIFQLRKQKNESTELENALTVYLDDMKEEHEELIRHLQALQKGEAKPNMAVSEDRGSIGKKGTPEPLSTQTKIEEKQTEKPRKDYTPPVVETAPNEGYETSFEASVLSMAEKGFTIEEIAKSLGRGKGEVELLIRLTKKNQKND